MAVNYNIAMNQFGEIASSALSNIHIADIKMVESLQAKLYVDPDYISQELKNKVLI